MRLPYWLLKLLPMWDYICPRCRKEVEKNSHRCPYCKERFGIPLKVPPKVLKDKTALESYVHEKIFPKVSPRHREYLTQFFTILFSDGFEDGTYNAWIIYEQTTGETISVVQTDPHHGSYHAKASCDGSSTNEAMSLKHDLVTSTYTSLYARGYFKLKTALPSPMYNSYQPFAMAGTGYWVALATVYWAFVGMTWSLAYRKNGANVQLVDTVGPAPVLDQWYCIELYGNVDSVNGAVKLYIDGVLRLSDSGFDNSECVNTRYVYAGERLSTGQNAHDIYFDDIVVADQYTGPDKRPIYIVFAQPGGTDPRKMYGVFK